MLTFTFRFLKSKVAILKQELEQSHQENVKSLRAYEGCVESNKKIAAQMDQLVNENASLKAQVEKLQSTNNTLETVMKVRKPRESEQIKPFSFSGKRYRSRYAKQRDCCLEEATQRSEPVARCSGQTFLKMSRRSGTLKEKFGQLSRLRTPATGC